jgi:type VI secretion system protein ImpF
MPAIVIGSPMPLFERLASTNGGPAAALIHGDALRDSVARELGRLLNTRSPLSAQAFLVADCTVLDYGMPDCSSRSLQSQPDRDAIIRLVERAVTVFEPRLRNASARFVEAGDARPPVLVIDGDLPLGTAPGRVAFELAAHGTANNPPRWTDHD